ncbi:hypothetical protein ACIQCR_24685 [Streptomyces sp. NPDC093249]|uniref:hypothetical protein n=1 Tax=unclassified Streptomyces TaxID=2593676 RepID=UPI00382EE08E
MTEIPDAIDVASLRTHRLILTISNAGAATLLSNLADKDVATVLRAVADSREQQGERPCTKGLFTGEPCPVHDLAEQKPTAAEPVPLRWGLGDVFHGDDGTVTIGSRRETYRILLARIDRLTAAEAALLVECAHAEMAASDALRSTQVGLERTVQDAREQVETATAAVINAERLARYLVAARQACGAETWPDVPHAVRRLAADRDRYATAHRSARARAARGQAAHEFADATAALADCWVLGRDPVDVHSLGPALLTLLDAYRERLWPSA